MNIMYISSGTVLACVASETKGRVEYVTVDNIAAFVVSVQSARLKADALGSALCFVTFLTGRSLLSFSDLVELALHALQLLKQLQHRVLVQFQPHVLCPRLGHKPAARALTRAGLGVRGGAGGGVGSAGGGGRVLKSKVEHCTQHLGLGEIAVRHRELHAPVDVGQHQRRAQHAVAQPGDERGALRAPHGCDGERGRFAERVLGEMRSELVRGEVRERRLVKDVGDRGEDDVKVVRRRRGEHGLQLLALLQRGETNKYQKQHIWEREGKRFRGIKKVSEKKKIITVEYRYKHDIVYRVSARKSSSEYEA